MLADINHSELTQYKTWNNKLVQEIVNGIYCIELINHEVIFRMSCGEPEF